MKQTRFILLSIILALIGFTSCKSDSDKMIEKCNAYIAALDSINNSEDLKEFANAHKDGLGDLVAAAKGDSIYSEQNLDEAKPIIFDAIYKNSEKLEYVLMQDSQSSLTTGLVSLIGIYTFRLPYCTKVSQLELMLRNLNRLSMPIFTKYQPNQFEMMTLRMCNDWVQSATVRKTEIEEGNLYNSQFLK
ncbi:MAG: hypothetical protein ACI30Y_07275 [Candidatus Limisoma sp.]|nr:hypothetical protein [bacterium]